jgi:hypothetical protein
MSEDDPLWQVVALTEYRLPVTPAKKAAERKLSGLWRLVWPMTEQSEPAKAKQFLSSITEEYQHGLTPAFNWHEAAQALDSRWSEWAEQTTSANRVQFLVGPPYSGQDKILHIWASRLGWEILPIPDRSQLLDCPKTWLETILNKPPVTGWYIPNLEHCFLRDVNGLDFIRQLLEAVFSGRLGRVAIACDSWAWSYLQNIWPVSAQQVFCMQGISAEHLADFYRLHIRREKSQRVRILNAKSGEDLLSTDTEECNNEFRWLAAIARGNPGICKHLWQGNLHRAIEQNKSGSADQSDPDLFWWSTPPQLFHIPIENMENSEMLLHTLLLHNGLSTNLLVKLLPLASTQTLALLYQFEQQGLVKQYHDNWRVAPLAYSEIRDLLSKSGYQTDQF